MVGLLSAFIELADRMDMMLRKVMALCQASAACLAVPIGSIWIAWRVAGGVFSFIGYALCVLGALAACLNFYLRFIRRPLFALRGQTSAEFKPVSGLPLVGMLVIPGLVFARPSLALSVACIVLVLADTGHLLWFVVAVWNDDSFWSS